MLSADQDLEMSHIKDENRTISLPNDQISSSVGVIHGLLSGKESVLKKGPWTPAEDEILADYVRRHGEGNWNSVQKHSGLSRCGKSCRLRWTNHLRPNLKKGPFTTEEEQLVVELHAKYGNKWARMTEFLPGRTDNEIKNYWNTRAKRLTRAGLPLYPSNLTFKLTDENLQNRSVTDLNFDGKQDDRNNIPDFIIEDPNSYQGSLSCSPPLPMNILYQELRSCNNLPSVYHDADQLLGSETLIKNYLDSSIINFPRIRLPGCTYGNIRQTYNTGLHYNPSPGSCMANPDDTFQGRHALVNGISPSLQPQLGAAKTELPSFQYSDVKTGTFSCSTALHYVGTGIDAHPEALPLKSECTFLSNGASKNMITEKIPSNHHATVGTGTDAHPEALPVKSECTFLSNDIIFGASKNMITEKIPSNHHAAVGAGTDAHPEALPVKSECMLLSNDIIFGASKNMITEKIPSNHHATVTDLIEATLHEPSITEWETSSGHISPMECSGASGVLSPINETSSSGSSDFVVKIETKEPFCHYKQTTSQVNFTRADCFLGLDRSSACLTEDSTLEDQLAYFLNEDYSSYHNEQLSAEPFPMANSASVLDSTIWESMPPVCQIPEQT